MNLKPRDKWAKAFGPPAGQQVNEGLRPYRARLETMTETELLAVAQALGILRSGRHNLGNKEEAAGFSEWAQGLISREP